MRLARTVHHDYADFRLSPDGTRLAASLIDPKVALPDIWLIDLVRGNSSRFTFGPAINAAAVWSPDGEQIAFRSTRKGLVELFLRSTAGGGTEQFLLGEEAARARGLGTSNLQSIRLVRRRTDRPHQRASRPSRLLSATGKKDLVRLTNSTLRPVARQLLA